MRWCWLFLLAGACTKPLPPASQTASDHAPATNAPATDASTVARAPSAGACRALPRFAHWQSLYGASVGLSNSWQDINEYSFFVLGVRNRLLTFDVTVHERPAEYLEEHREQLLEAYRERADRKASSIRSVHSALGTAHYYELSFGAAESEVQAFAVIRDVTLHLRGTRRDVASVPAMLAGLEALAPEHLRAPAGRYPIYGITFTWPERLTSPERFRFESNDGAWLRLDWAEAQPALTETRWSQRLSLPLEATLQALRTERGEARLVPVCPPPGFAGSGLSWNHLAGVVRAKNSDGVPMVHVHAQAYAKVGGRYLVAEYSDEDHEASTLDEFYEVLSTIHAEHVPRSTVRE